MQYRSAILSTILLAGAVFTIPALAAGEQAETFAGSCSSGTLTSHPLDYGTLSESDGVRAVSNGMSGKDYLAVTKQAKLAHLALGADGMLWSTKPVPCDSATVWVKAKSNPKGDTLVAFSNGDPANMVLGFTGAPVDGDGPLFSPDSIYVGDGKPAMELSPSDSGQSCHFYFLDHGTFTEGWENRLTAIECNVKMRRADGHLISADVRFDRARTPTAAATSNGATSSTQPASGLADSSNAQASQLGHEWMQSAPAYCQATSYGALTPEQRASCDEAAFRALSKHWQNVTASNGQVYEVALDTISRDLPGNVNPGATLRSAMVLVYEAQGEPFNANNVVTFYFDCHDHYQTFQRDWSPVAYFPPLSVTAEIASIACDTVAR